MRPQLAVYVHDDDYDELTVRFYNAYNGSILGECSMVESDSNVSIPLDGLPDNGTFSWYVIVTDQKAAIISSTWRFIIEMNDTGTMSSEEEEMNSTAPPSDPFEFIDLSPATVVTNATYTFQVYAQNHSIIQEIMVHYWYNDTAQTDLALCFHEGVWDASILITSNATCFWYLFYVCDSTGAWNVGDEQEVSITSGGGDGA
jgi:hypothetical protein